jgi:hypothetical protein
MTDDEPQQLKTSLQRVIILNASLTDRNAKGTTFMNQNCTICTMLELEPKIYLNDVVTTWNVYVIATTGERKLLGQISRKTRARLLLAE